MQIGNLKSVRDRQIGGDVSVRELWQLLVKRRNVFFLSLAVCVAAAAIVSLVMPRRYEAVVRLNLDFESNALRDAITTVSGGGDADDIKLQTQVRILETDSLAWAVIRKLRLDQRPEASHRRLLIGPPTCLSGSGQAFESVSSECRDVLLREFHRRMRVEPLPRTQILEVRYRCESPELAAQVANTLAETFAEETFQSKYDAALQASHWVSRQLEDAKNNAEIAEQKYIAYQKQSGIIGTDENHNILIERLNAINQQLVVAEATRIVREARYRASLDGDPEALVEMSPGTALQSLHAEQATLRSQYAQLLAKFDEKYPRVVQVKAQLDEATASLKDEIARSRDRIRSEYDAALKGESLLRKAFEDQKQQAYDTSEATMQTALLKRDLDASRELYEELVKQLNEAGILAGLRSTRVIVVDPAATPVRAAEPRLELNLALALVTGSLLGILFCFLQENLDTTILSPQDLAVSAVPALGVVPRLTGVKMLGRGTTDHAPQQIAALDRPDGIVADAYRSLRTALLLSNAGNPPRVILIASALPREGKTTTSINLALVFAQKDQKVLLVDGDMRKADLNRCFGISPNGGLSDVLAGGEPSQYYVHYAPVPNLTILPAGTRPPKPPDLLDSERMREMVASWRRDYERVIIDAPPVIGLSDAMILATMADTTVLVLRARQSRHQDLSLAQEILGSVNANVCGVLVNDFQTHSTIYGHSAKSYGKYFDEKRRVG